MMIARTLSLIAAMGSCLISVGSLYPMPAKGADLAIVPADRPAYTRQNECGNVKDIEDGETVFLQYRWCPVHFNQGDGIMFEARRDFYRSDNGHPFQFQKKAEYYDCEVAQDRQFIPTNTKRLQC